jgi:hypothetical protein
MTHYSIALVSDVPELTREALEPVAQALRIQTNGHFLPKWPIAQPSGVTIEAHTEAGIPPGFWPIKIQADIGDPSAAGFHTDANNQPYALIQYAPDWTVTASHELLEMLFDPFGNALAPATINGKPVQVLQELCDPCEGFSYPIAPNRTQAVVTVSDFLTPHYYERSPFEAGHHFSFLNKLSGPMDVGVDGYLSYLDGNEWFQITNFAGQGIVVSDLGPNDKAAREGMSLREWISQVSKIERP